MVFDWRSISLIASLYLVLVVIMVSLAYSEPDYKGLVAPHSYRVIFYSDSPRLAVLSSANSTTIYGPGGVYSLGFPVSHACYDGSYLIVSLPEGLGFIDLDRGTLTTAVFGLEGVLVGLTCSRSPYAILALGDGVFLVNLSGGFGFRLPGLTISGGVGLLSTPRGLYVASGNSVVFVNSSEAYIYRLPSVVSIHGLTLSGEGLVVYGSWDDVGLVYRFMDGEAMLVSVPGRVTSVDALACHDYRCWAVVRPHGDWLIVVEFNNWRYTSHARIVAVKPFVYHKSGSSDRVWISGELVDLGVAVLGVMSTREAVVGFNSTHAVLYTEGYILPSPRLSKIKVYPHTERVEVEVVEVKLLKSIERLQQGSNIVRAVEPQVDRLATLITLMVVTLPILVYLYSSTAGDSKG